MIEKRGPIKLGETKTKRDMLNLLEVLYGVDRQTIKNECSKKKIDLSNYDHVALYIKSKLR